MSCVCQEAKSSPADLSLESQEESLSEQGKERCFPRGVASTEDVKAADRTPTTGNRKDQQGSGQGYDPGNRELEVEVKGQHACDAIHCISGSSNNE